MDIKEMKSKISELEEKVSELEYENEELDSRNDDLLDENFNLKQKDEDQTLSIEFKDKPTMNDQITLEYVQRNWEELKEIACGV